MKKNKMSLLHQVGLEYFFCVEIFLLILWKEIQLVQSEQSNDNKRLHRRAIEQVPFDIYTIKLDPGEYVQSEMTITPRVVCSSYFYRKYLNDYPELPQIKLTDEQLEELFYDILFNSLQNILINEANMTIFVAPKNFPDAIRNNLENNYKKHIKFLDGNYLNLQICRGPLDFMGIELIFKENYEKVPPLEELRKTKSLATTTSSTTTSPTTKYPVKTNKVKDCSVDMVTPEKIKRLIEIEFSQVDWIAALNKYSQTDRPSCYRKRTTQPIKTCFCEVNYDFKSWVCADQVYKAKEIILEISSTKYYTALEYLIEVLSLCQYFINMLE